MTLLGFAHLMNVMADHTFDHTSQRRLLASSLHHKNSTNKTNEDANKNTFTITLDWYWIFGICLGAGIIIAILIVIYGYCRMLVNYIVGRAS